MAGREFQDEVIVVGCGVIGLTTARCLQDRGFRVRIIAAQIPPQTTSDIAPAMWHPYKVQPDERMRSWAARSFNAYQQLSQENSNGVRPVTIREYYANNVEEPWYCSIVGSSRRLKPDELPRGYGDGYSTESFVIDSSIFMPRLLDQFLDHGGTVERRSVQTPEEFIFGNGVVVNCTGIGARDFAHDEGVYPISGQVVRVNSQYRESTTCHIDENGALSVCYIVPRVHDVLIGGTAREGDWSVDVERSTTEDILAKARILVPELKDAEVLSSAVGLRPARATVRVEQDVQYPWLIHNYGHSGAGFTLAWGCAAEAAELVAQTVGKSSWAVH